MKFRVIRLLAIALLLGTTAWADSTITWDLTPEVNKLMPPPKPAPKPKEQPKNNNVIGRIGFTKVSVGIFRERSMTAKRYLLVPAGVTVAVIKEADGWLGLLMNDGRPGWVPRDSIELVNLRLADGIGSPIVQTAFQYLGIPYVWGGTSQYGTDCSGFVLQVFRRFGIHLPRTARQQVNVGRPIGSIYEALPGDRVYFAKDGVIDHTGIYIGDGRMIHATSAYGHVMVEKLVGGRLINRMVAIRR
ncbi:MAG: C40 family peptidase [Armatimonadota bacterium]